MLLLTSPAPPPSQLCIIPTLSAPFSTRAQFRCPHSGNPRGKVQVWLISLPLVSGSSRSVGEGKRHKWKILNSASRAVSKERELVLLKMSWGAGSVMFVGWTSRNLPTGTADVPGAPGFPILHRARLWRGCRPLFPLTGGEESGSHTGQNYIRTSPPAERRLLLLVSSDMSPKTHSICGSLS